MRKGDNGMKVWGLIVVLVVVGSVFSSIVSAEIVSEDLMESVADVGNHRIQKFAPGVLECKGTDTS